MSCDGNASIYLDLLFSLLGCICLGVAVLSGICVRVLGICGRPCNFTLKGTFFLHSLTIDQDKNRFDK